LFIVYGLLMADNFKNLEVWKKAMSLAKTTYHLTANFPKQEIYGLTSQLRSCAISVPSNIAEGSARRSPKEFVRFLNIAEAS
jgi:four helix bundle protein